MRGENERREHDRNRAAQPRPAEHDAFAPREDAVRRRARTVSAAIGDALAFPSWESLTQEQGLGDDEAAELICAFVAAAEAS